METKNKGGRPTKSTSERRRYTLLVRLNTSEHYTLQHKAKEAGVSRVELVRQFIMNGVSKARIRPEEMKTIRTIAGVANNLNQITCRLNAKAFNDINEEMNTLRQIIHELLKCLRS